MLCGTMMGSVSRYVPCHLKGKSLKGLRHQYCQHGGVLCADFRLTCFYKVLFVM